MRLSGIAIGQYCPGDSVFHKADPRSKIAVTFLYVIVLFLISGFGSLAIMGATLLVAVAAARIPASWLFRSARPVFWLVVITFLFQMFLAGGEEMARLGPVPIYRQGLYNGGFLAARLVLLALSGTLLTFTTPPVLLTDALGRMLAPLTKLRIPVYELALMVTIALRFIPTLLMELDRIITAQRARGAEIGRGGPIRKARGLMPILVPLFVLSFRNADELADAMESRCWRGGKGRTVRRRLKLRRLDFWLLAAAGVILAVSLWWGR